MIKCNVRALTVILSACFVLSGCNQTESIKEKAANTVSHNQITKEEKSALELKIKDALCINSLCPAGDYDEQDVVDHGLLILANNEDSKFADWVAYKVEKEYLEGPSRDRQWSQDPLLPSDDTLPPSAYKGVHARFKTDRGHLAPLGSFKGHENYHVVNYLSNITPQKSELNQGPWRELEEAVRDLSRERGDVYVVTGPYYEASARPTRQFLPHYEDALIIPAGYFKIVAQKDSRGVKATAFLMKQSMTRKADYCDAIVSDDRVDQVTDLDVLPGITLSGNLNRELGCRV